MKNMMLELSCDPQTLFNRISTRGKRMSFIVYENGIFYNIRKNHFDIIKINTPVQHPFRRVLRCKIKKEGNQNFIQCKFVFKKIYIAAAALVFWGFIYGNISMLLSTDISNFDKLLIECIFLVVYLVLCTIVLSGKFLFRQAEKETIDFLKKIIEKN